MFGWGRVWVKITLTQLLLNLPEILDLNSGFILELYPSLNPEFNPNYFQACKYILIKKNYCNINNRPYVNQKKTFFPIF